MKSDFKNSVLKAPDDHHQLGRAGERIGWDLKLRLAYLRLSRRVARARSDTRFGAERVDHMKRAVCVEERVLVAVEPWGGVPICDEQPFGFTIALAIYVSGLALDHYN